MSTRFRVDLLHPGWVAHTWQEWFVGTRGLRRLTWFVLGTAGILAAVFVALIWPTERRMARDRETLADLGKRVAMRDADLSVLRSNLQALADEARRQVRWAELLTTLSQQIPATLKLQLVEIARTTPPAPAGSQAKPETLLRIEAMTPLRPGSSPLVEVAQFMAGVMRDPAVNEHFQLKSWEIKPGPSTAPAGSAEPMLNVSIVLSERTP
jgi:hypothetical protein